MTDKSIEKVAIVIPNFNGADFIEEAIDSLLKQTQPSTIIVVENGSSDNSLDVLAKYTNRITLIKNDRNLGFAGGVNTGIQYALDKDFDAVALFNNDAVAKSDWLKKLVLVMSKHNNAGIVTSRIQLSGDKELDSTGEFYTSWGLPYPRGRGNPTDSYVNEEEIFGASGGASLYRASTFREIGLFDDKFFAYYEDTDISFRAQLAGWKVRYTPDAIVTHRKGETSKKMIRGFTVYQTFKNLPMLFWKNVPHGLIFRYGTRFYVAYLLIFSKALLSGKAWPAVRGVFSATSLIPHTFHQRRVIQKHKKVTADYIRSIVVSDLPPDQTGIRKMRKIFTGK